MLLSPVSPQEGGERIVQANPGDLGEKQYLVHKTQTDFVLLASHVSAQTLDSSELQGDGIVLSLEEQLSAMSLTSSPSPSGSGPDPKATVSLNGTRFPSQLFEDTSLSTKVSGGVVHCPLSRLPCAKDEPCR